MIASKSLPKQERLSSRKIINNLFSNGKSFNESPFTIKYDFVPLPEDVPCQFAVSVPKRNFKKASQRNRIKRVIKEAYRLHKNELRNVLLQQDKQCALFMVFTGKDVPQFEEVEHKIILLLQRLQNKCEQE